MTLYVATLTEISIHPLLHKHCINRIILSQDYIPQKSWCHGLGLPYPNRYVIDHSNEALNNDFGQGATKSQRSKLEVVKNICRLSPSGTQPTWGKLNRQIFSSISNFDPRYFWSTLIKPKFNPNQTKLFSQSKDQGGGDTMCPMDFFDNNIPVFEYNDPIMV